MKRIMKFMTAISLLLCLCISGYSGSSQKIAAKTKPAYMYQLKKQQLHSFQNITAALGNMDLKIKPSKDNKYYLSYKLYCYNSKTPLTYHIKDNTLHINSTRIHSALYKYQKGSKTNYHVYTSLMQATVFVPSGKLTDITLSGKHPDISIHNILCQNVSIKVTHGDVSISGINSDKLQIETDAGDISFSDLKTSGLLQTKTKTGDLTAAGLDVSGTAKFTTNYGDIRLSDLSVSGTAEFTTNYGDIRLPDLSITGKIKINTGYGDVGLKIKEKCLKPLGVTLKTAEGNMSAAKSLGGKKKRYKEFGWRYVKNAPDNGASLAVSTHIGNLSLEVTP